MHSIPFSIQRRIVAAASAVNNEYNTIHSVCEVEVETPRRLIREYKERTGKPLSFTAYVVACVGRALVQHPELNSFRRGRKLILLDDVTVNTLVEREHEHERTPESLAIKSAQTKTVIEISEEIRAAQAKLVSGFGELSGSRWVTLIPSFLLKTFIRIAARSLTMAKKYGKVGVTAVGMFGDSGASWFIPLSGATVNVTVGSVVNRAVVIGGKVTTREHLCLTVSFDHDIVDGAPAARFMKTFQELIRSGGLLEEFLHH
jgi:pyruvate/2-oxoglutarate dehydrogenase complex dihydrolipoamide acyltransferase (E2) component